MSHTTEPWKKAQDIQLAGFWLSGGNEATANTERVLACVNGCAGLNPAAYQQVVAALKNAVWLTGVEDDHLEWMRHGRDYEQLAGVYGGRLSAIQQQLQAAIAQVEREPG